MASATESVQGGPGADTNSRLTRVEDRLESHEGRLDSLDLALNAVRQDIKNTEAMLLQRVERVEVGIGGKVDNLHTSVNSQFRDIQDRFYSTLQTAANNIPSRAAVWITVCVAALVGIMSLLAGIKLGGG